MKLTDMVEVIRSKNAGPGTMTFDIIFKNRKYYEAITKNNIFTKVKIAGLYGVDEESVTNIIYYEAGNAIKIVLVRHIMSGNVGDLDVYGCQQTAPFYAVEIPDSLIV